MCRPNPHHWTHYSTECDTGRVHSTTWGVGCDGSCMDCGGSCDCSCHGNNAPDFVTEDDVKEYHS